MWNIEDYKNKPNSIWKRAIKWLYPGMRVKRWIILMIIGATLAAFGCAILIGPDGLAAFGRKITNLLKQWRQPSPTPFVKEAGIVLIALGIFAASWGFRQVIRSLVIDILPSDPKDLAEIIFHKRGLDREPALVVIGGGTGLSTLLRGLKNETERITAIVTVADDGGSSGRIRTELGILPPGDIRNTLVALANTEPMMEQLFQHRFSWGDGLQGHSFGNLFIAAMTEITGDFEEAIRASSQVLAVRGQVLPSTLSSVTLRAEYDDGTVTVGESLIPQNDKTIHRVFLEPEDCRPVPEAIEAIQTADAIILGPGSLYTSVLPNLLVKEIREAIRNSPAPRIYICNVMTQPGETQGYTAAQHIKAIIDHAGPGLIDYAIVNTVPIPQELQDRYLAKGAVPVEADLAEITALGIRPVEAPVISMTDLVRHDPDKLAAVIHDLLVDE